MRKVNVSYLKNHLTEALKSAKTAPVVVMNRDTPDAMIVSLQSGKLLSETGVRTALATALFRDGGFSLSRAAKMAGMPLANFIAHLSRLGISVVDYSAEETLKETESLEAWLAGK
jgi:predicted HTH domain antitoxin